MRPQTVGEQAVVVVIITVIIPGIIAGPFATTTQACMQVPDTMPSSSMTVMITLTRMITMTVTSHAKPKPVFTCAYASKHATTTAANIGAQTAIIQNVNLGVGVDGGSRGRDSKDITATIPVGKTTIKCTETRTRPARRTSPGTTEGDGGAGAAVAVAGVVGVGIIIIEARVEVVQVGPAPPAIAIAIAPVPAALTADRVVKGRWVSVKVKVETGRVACMPVATISISVSVSVSGLSSVADRATVTAMCTSIDIRNIRGIRLDVGAGSRAGCGLSCSRSGAGIDKP